MTSPRDVTSIECPRTLHSRLTDLKLFPDESYASVIARYLPAEHGGPRTIEGHHIRFTVKKKEESFELPGDPAAQSGGSGSG